VTRHLPTLPPYDEGPVPPWPGQERAAGEYRLFVRRAPAIHGDSQPAVFVHGLGGASTNWTDLMYLLRDRLDCHAPDLPGFGRSPAPPGEDYRLDSHVRAVGRLVDALGAPVHLFGNSLGGAVATRLAAERPDLVRTLTLVAPALPSLWPRRESLRLALFLAPGLGRRLFTRLRGRSAEAQAQAVLELCYADPSRVHPQRRAEAAEEIRRRSALGPTHDAFLASLQGLVASYLEAGARSLSRQARRVSAPTLLVFGGRDPLVDARVAPWAARAFRHNRLIVLPDAGHVAQLEHPEVVAGAVRDMLDRACWPVT
jgi:pimeloyl-ACP methyl ester carboxylesterase